MRLIVLLCMALALTAPPTSAVGIFELISNGDLDQAADSLSSVTTAGLRDGNLLFYASLLETDGEKSVRLMEIFPELRSAHPFNQR